MLLEGALILPKYGIEINIRCETKVVQTDPWLACHYHGTSLVILLRCLVFYTPHEYENGAHHRCRSKKNSKHPPFWPEVGDISERVVDICLVVDYESDLTLGGAAVECFARAMSRRFPPLRESRIPGLRRLCHSNSPDWGYPPSYCLR